jgi:4-hydroxybenzoate polyprenyltransferase/phosphoserine phosphatase
METLVNGRGWGTIWKDLGEETLSVFMASAQQHYTPLCVDLDGTLIGSDLLFESLIQCLRNRPALCLLWPLWLMRGKAYFKRQLAKRHDIDPVTLPYNTEVLDWLKQERKSGRTLILCTASDEILARRVADHLGLFDEVIASDGLRNVSGVRKSQLLVERFGSHGFDYAGNSKTDVAVWRCCHSAVVVNAPRGVLQSSRQVASVERVFPRTASKFGVLRILRPHQWLKNLLIFVPMVTGHRIFELRLLERSLVMFVAFCMCASGAYMLNDLIDLESDRQHPTKRRRPFASGKCPLVVGLFLAPIFPLAGFVLVSFLGPLPLLALAAYVAGTLFYSWYLKRKALLDVFALSGLYALRVGAGHVSTGIAYSPWLFSFCMFTFLSLACSKRVSELRNVAALHQTWAAGRAYHTGDILQLNIFGVSCGFLASLVLTLYISSPAVAPLYKQPLLLWTLCPLFLYWINRIWLFAGRGNLNEDPLIFAARDRVTYAVVAVAGVVIALATFDWLPAF